MDNRIWFQNKEIHDKNYYFRLSNDILINDLFVKDFNDITLAIDLITFSIVENVLFVTAKKTVSENIAKILQ